MMKGIFDMAKLIIRKSGGAPADVSGLTATPADVEKGKVFYGLGSDKVQVGTVENRGVLRQSIGANGSYTFPPGIYAAGGYINQNIPVQDGFVINPVAGGSSAGVRNKYMKGNIVVNGVANLSPENIRKGAFIGTVAGTWEGYVNNSPLTPYWYGIFYPGQTGREIYNRSPNIGTLAGTSINWSSGTAKPNGRYIHLTSYATGGTANSEYPAFRFEVPIEMDGVKSVSIMYRLRSHSANQYTWIVLAEKEVNNVTGGQTWNLSESNLGAYESHTLPATVDEVYDDSQGWSVQTFSLTNARRYKYIYVGIGVAASRNQGRIIDVKYIKLNKG